MFKRLEALSDKSTGPLWAILWWHFVNIYWNSEKQTEAKYGKLASGQRNNWRDRTWDQKYSRHCHFLNGETFGYCVAVKYCCQHVALAIDSLSVKRPFRLLHLRWLWSQNKTFIQAVCLFLAGLGVMNYKSSNLQKHEVSQQQSHATCYINLLCL